MEMISFLVMPLLRKLNWSTTNRPVRPTLILIKYLMFSFLYHPWSFLYFSSLSFSFESQRRSCGGRSDRFVASEWLKCKINFGRVAMRPLDWLLPTRQRENTGGGCQYGPMRELWWRSAIAFLQPQHWQSSKDAQRGLNSQINLEVE